ncbi:glycosyltransferase involved in cell wall biosynthesis [Dyadobacter jejuensis]|uniref:Glycosyltransferase involved in cell wall biosynthesis n=2 Tax=Dyadobacter jejuensis TaxID=1082580 RepID=A0A316ADY1_9BACT|nr:glycosyltransferase involved in cell wall biosynthesis [Dyadobacter jejuensis]
MQTQKCLFVFSDQALGPWVKYVKNYPNVVHCHDFLAQQSAFGMIKENPTSKSGKIYQTFIRDGYRHSNNFISVSRKTESDLLKTLLIQPQITKVVYNGLTQTFLPAPKQEIIAELTNHTKLDISKGYILHVGGNQWYKNRIGVIEIYDQWRKINNELRLPLIMVGAAPNKRILKSYEESGYKMEIEFLINKPDDIVKKFYQGANVFLFPSIAEGFGWPIAEAMACGTIVITTNEAPMNEVGGEAAIYINKRPTENHKLETWLVESALILDQVLNLDYDQKSETKLKGFQNIKRFSSNHALDQISQIYQSIESIQ